MVESLDVLLVLGHARLLGPVVETVLAAEKASGHGRPDGGAIAFVEDVRQLDLEGVPDEHIVLGLLDDWLVQIVLLAYSDGIYDLPDIPLTGPPVEGLVRADQLVEGSAHFLQGSLGVEAVGVHDVHVLQLQSLQTLVHILDHVFPIHSYIIQLLLTSVEPV